MKRVPHPEGRRVAVSTPFDPESIRWVRGIAARPLVLTSMAEFATYYAPKHLPLVLDRLQAENVDKVITVF